MRDIAETGRPRHFKSLWPNDAIWWHISRSTLAQVMADGTKYLKQSWLIIRWHNPRTIWKYQSVKPDWISHFLKSHPDSPGPVRKYRSNCKCKVFWGQNNSSDMSYFVFTCIDKTRAAQALLLTLIQKYDLLYGYKIGLALNQLSYHFTLP